MKRFQFHYPTICVIICFRKVIFVDKTNRVKDLSIYQKKYDEDVSSFKEFEALDFIRQLKNQDRLDEAIEVGRTFLEQRPDLSHFINQYGYALFNKYIKEGTPANEDLYFEIADEILNITKQERYSPYEATINAVVKYALAKNPSDYATAVRYLSRLDATLLDKEPYVDDAGHEGESRFERWYRMMVRFLYESGDYARCIEISNQAMTLNIRWHHRNAYWIRLYRAKSHLARGEYDQCEHEYLALQAKFRGTNFNLDLYHMFAGLNEDKKANAYLLYEVFISGYDQSQISLYRLLLEASKKAGQDKIADLIEAMLCHFDLEAGKTIDGEVPYPNETSGSLYDLAYDELMNNLDAYVERKKGKVVFYNEERKFGLIAEGKEPATSFYQADFIDDEEVKKYKRASYTLLNFYDNRKQQVSQRAILLAGYEDDSFNFNFGY